MRFWHLVSFIVVMVFLPLPSHALGITPSTIVLEHVRPGMRVARTLTITHTIASESRTFAIRMQGNGGAFIEGEDAVMLPAGASSVVYPIVIAPTSVARGQYEAQVVVEEGVVGNGKSISKNIKSNVVATVRILVDTSTYRSFSIENAAFEQTFVGEPLKLRLTVRNNGNVGVRMDKIALAMVREGGRTVREAVIPVSDIPVVEPFTTATFVVVTDTAFPEGVYRAQLTFTEANEEIGSLDNIPVRVQRVPTSATYQAKISGAYVQRTRVRAKEVVLLKGEFKNESKDALQPVMYAIIRRGGMAENVSRSEIVQVAPGEKRTMEVEVVPRRAGKYAVDVYFVYGSSESSHKIFPLRVVAPVPWYVSVLYSMVIVLALAVVWLLFKELRV